MIFNFWRPLKWFKPKKDGWYQCTARHGNGIDQACVMDIYYNTRENKWIDRRRQDVFDGYKVYKPCRAPIDDNRVFTDGQCERIDIVAWRKLPKVYQRRKWRKNND